MSQKFITVQRIPAHGTPDTVSLEVNSKTPDRLIVIGGLNHCTAIKFDREAREALRRWLDEQDAADVQSIGAPVYYIERGAPPFTDRFNMRQTRYRQLREAGNEHPHDLMAVGFTAPEIRDLIAKTFPDATIDTSVLPPA